MSNRDPLCITRKKGTSYQALSLFPRMEEKLQTWASDNSEDLGQGFLDTWTAGSRVSGAERASCRPSKSPLMAQDGETLMYGPSETKAEWGLGWGS